MKNIYIWILILNIFVMAGCTKKVQLTKLEGIKEYQLGIRDSLYVLKLKERDDNYLGLKEETVAAILKNYIDTVSLEKYIADPLISQELEREMRIFYSENSYQLPWSKGSKPSADAQFLLNKLNMAHEEGLNPEDYRAYELLNKLGKTYNHKRHINIFELIDLDLHLTGALLSYGWHLENGRIDPGLNDWRWAFEIPKEPVAARLSAALQHKKLKQELELLVPQHEQYSELKKGLLEMQDIANKGGWPMLPADLKVEEGDTSELVPLVRERLVASNDHRNLLWKKNLQDPVFDSKLKEAVADFQRRHGLVDDGIVGKATIEKLNIPVEEKIEIIKLNLERLRWLPNNMAKDYILVNLPEYKLKVFENNKEVWDMRVIVGQSYKHATPIFHDELEYLVLSPTWGVPRSITYNEILPKVKRDPGYISRNGYQLYVDGGPVDPGTVDWNSKDLNIRVVQKSGPSNALGLVKFIMPNKFNIYLHDTPSDYLFNRAERDFSHGCIRLEEPKKLAEYLLQDDKEWDSERIEEHMHKDYATTVWLKEPKPVYIVYQTAFMDNGVLNFRKDIYDHDKNQTKLLAFRK